MLAEIVEICTIALKNFTDLLEGKTILIADDNKLNQRIVAFVLQKSGAEVKTAGNGSEVIDFLKANKCDAVLLDLQMPEMDGPEAAKYIRQNMKLDIPLIGLTANTLFGDAERCLEAGMNDCVAKPFDDDKLCALIAKYINK